MKLVGIVGSNAEFSYNRLLLQYIAKQFTDLFTLEVLEIDDIPLFNQSDDQTNSAPIQRLNHKILNADGVIIATPEHNHTIPASLKSVIEWLSFNIHPFENKPVMIVGASYFKQGTSRAQVHLRKIMEAPGVHALVMPGNEFLLGNAKEAFDENNQLKDERTIGFLRSCLEKFVKYIGAVSVLGSKPALPPEDLFASGTVETSVEGVDMYAEDWLEQASEKVSAAEGNTYVKLNCGLLTVDQINHFLASMPMELTYVDHNNQFLYYNKTKEAEDMLASRKPSQVGNPLGECHPEAAYKNVEWVIQQLRSGRSDCIRVHIPVDFPEKYLVHNYQAIKDEQGNYLGVNEYVQDIKPIIDWYLKQTGQILVKANQVDGVSSASVKEASSDVDGVSSASVKA